MPRPASAGFLSSIPGRTGGGVPGSAGGVPDVSSPDAESIGGPDSGSSAYPALPLPPRLSLQASPVVHMA